MHWLTEDFWQGHAVSLLELYLAMQEGRGSALYCVVSII